MCKFPNLVICINNSEEPVEKTGISTVTARR